MNDESDDADDRAENRTPITRREASLHDSVQRYRGLGHHLSKENVEWLREEYESLDYHISVTRVRHEYAETWHWLTGWVHGKQTWTRLKLVRLLVERPLGVTYKTIEEEIDVSYSTATSLVKTLREHDVATSNGSPSQVQFTSDDMEMLAREVVSFG